MSFMRVRHLIDMLKDIDPEMPVAVEGCDCTAYAGGVAVEDNDYPEPHQTLMVLRSEEAGGACHESDELRLFTGEE